MNPFTILRVEIIKRPIFNILFVLLAIFWWSLWWAVIVLTLLVRLLLIKNSAAAANMQWSMKELQPKMQEIQDKHKDDPERMSQEMMKLFKTSGKWPLKWCLTMLIQIPVFLGLFFTVRDIALWQWNPEVYSFLAWISVDLSTIQTDFYGIDLLAKNNVLLTLLAAWFMYIQMKFTTLMRPSTPSMWGMWGKKMPNMKNMMGYMNIFFVIMMGWFVWTMPSAIWLYIITTTLFWVLQQSYQYRSVLRAKFLAWRWTPQVIEWSDGDTAKQADTSSDQATPVDWVIEDDSKKS